MDPSQNEPSPNNIQSDEVVKDDIFNSNVVNPPMENSENESPIKKTITRDELKNDQTLLKKSSSSFDKNQYIQPTDWNYVNDDYITELETKFGTFENNINKRQYANLCKSVRNCKLEVVHRNPNTFYNVNPLSTLEYLVESTFFYDKSLKAQMLLHITELEDNVYRWRSIKGDGNCFYRACIFSFLENIIFTNNIMLLKEFIVMFDEKITVDNPNIKNIPYIQKEMKKVDRALVSQILYLIMNGIDNGKIGDMTPYEILLKSINFCNQFDYGMIFFFRYLIYEFIKSNLDKAYTTEFSVKIGNLLPSEYETDKGEFLYDKFFEEQLLRMNTDAEKIVIYLTPFVLKSDLNIIMYEFDMEDSVFTREFKCGMDKSFKIELLFRKTHYDITYSKGYFDMYQKEFSSYVNINENIRVIDTKSLNCVREMKKKNEESKEKLNINVIQVELNENTVVDINANDKGMNSEATCLSCKQPYTSKENFFGLCDKCLDSELDSQMFGFYLMYLQSALREYNKQRVNLSKYCQSFFNTKECIINGQPLPISQAASIAGISLPTLITRTKQKICVACQEAINDDKFYIKLPCSCVLCTQKCFEKFFNYFITEDIEFKEQNNYNYPILANCLCGYQYNNNDYCTLYKEFEKRKYVTYMNGVRDIIIDTWRKKCMVCLQKYSENIQFRTITLKDKRLTEEYRIKEIKHLLCNECFEKIKKDKDVECLLCGCGHKIKKIGGDSDCIIF